jgi:hypothetical protein
MKWKSARLALLVLLLMTMAIRAHAVAARNSWLTAFDFDSAVKALLRDSDYTMRRNPVGPPSVLSSAVYFMRPGCAQPSILMPFGINYEALPYLQRIAPEGYARSYIYLDGIWPVQNRSLMFIKWLRAAALDTIGRGSFLPVTTAVALAEPAECRADSDIDWRLIWDRAWYRSHVRDAGQSQDRTGDTAASAHVHS